MIIPISNGRTIIPVYIPTTVTSANSGYTNTQNSEPTLWNWIALGIVIIFLIASVVCFIKFIKGIFGGE